MCSFPFLMQSEWTSLIFILCKSGAGVKWGNQCIALDVQDEDQLLESDQYC